jgi:gluconate 2-dehydrogenase
MADLAADNLIAFFGGKGPLTPVTPVPAARK